MKERDFYDAAWERLVALKSYKLISTRSRSFILTRERDRVPETRRQRVLPRQNNAQ